MGSIMSVKKEKSSYDLINEKKASIEEFLNNISQNMPSIGLPQEYYEHSVKLLDTEYKYGINHVITINGFFDQLKPKNKNHLIFIVL